MHATPELAASRPRRAALPVKGIPAAYPLLGGLLVSLVLHVVLGWGWTILGGVLVGAWVRRRGWLLGMVAVGLDWLLLVVYSWWAAAEAFGRMVAAVGELFGNMPGAAVVACTLSIGLLLGAVGGALGARLRRLVTGRPAPAPG